MSKEPLEVALVAALLLAAGAVAWWFEIQPEMHVDAAPLVALPMTMDDWRGQTIPNEDTIERILRADFNLQREYRKDAATPPVWFYIGYYGTTRGGQPEHMPAQCYPAAGWAIEDESLVEIDPARDFSANRYVVSYDDEFRVVYFWLRSSRRTGMTDVFDAGLDRLRGRLSDGRSEGALVRISTPIGISESAADERLRSFARGIDSMLGDHWPAEDPIR